MKFNRQLAVGLIRRLFPLLAVIYVALTVGAAVYKNYQTNQRIDGLKAKVAQVKRDIGRQELLNIYYQSATFKELEARRRLGLKKPDEKVFILPKREEVVSQEGLDQSQTITSPEEEIPHYRKWVEFVLGV